jgi:TctA family transporter
MVWIMVIANLITVTACFLFLAQLVRITQIKGSYIIPVLLVLIVLGGYTATNQFADVWVMLFFGALGWIMVELDWPRPPLVLGLVLGRLAENYLFLSVSRYELGWLLRPGVLVGLAIIVVAVFYPLIAPRLPGYWQKLGMADDR